LFVRVQRAGVQLQRGSIPVYGKAWANARWPPSKVWCSSDVVWICESWFDDFVINWLGCVDYWWSTPAEKPAVSGLYSFLLFMVFHYAFCWIIWMYFSLMVYRWWLLKIVRFQLKVVATASIQFVLPILFFCPTDANPCDNLHVAWNIGGVSFPG